MRGDGAATIVARWQPGLQEFLALRQGYLLYPDTPLSDKPAWTMAPDTPGRPQIKLQE